MKKLLLLTLAVVFVLALSACNTNTSQSAIENVSEAVSDKESVTETPAADAQKKAETPSEIVQSKAETPSESTQSKAETPSKAESTNKTAVTRDEAISVALKKAGLKRDEVHDLEAELDYERGVKVWEVDFEKGYTDYSYDINAETGEILRTETEYD